MSHTTKTQSLHIWISSTSKICVSLARTSERQDKCSPHLSLLSSFPVLAVHPCYPCVPAVPGILTGASRSSSPTLPIQPCHSHHSTFPYSLPYIHFLHYLLLHFRSLPVPASLITLSGTVMPNSLPETRRPMLAQIPPAHFFVRELRRVTNVVASGIYRCSSYSRTPSPPLTWVGC